MDGPGSSDCPPMQMMVPVEGYEQQRSPSPWMAVRGDQLARAGRYKQANKTFFTIMMGDNSYCKWVLDHVQTLEDNSMRAFARFLMQHYQKAQASKGGRDPLGDQKLAVHDPYKETVPLPTYAAVEPSSEPSVQQNQMAMLQEMMANAAALMSMMGSSPETRGSTAAASAAASDLRQEPIFRPRRAREEADSMDIEQEIPDLPSEIPGCSQGDMGWRNMTVAVLHKRQRCSQRLSVAAHAAAMSR